MEEVIIKETQYNYTGTIQTVTLEPGKYILDCYGARGGHGYGMSSGGYGGRVSGYLFLTETTTLYLYVGQIGNDGNSRRSSWNGGSIGGTDNRGGAENGGAGGGATDVRIGGTDLSNRVIVAGGGGGAGGWSSSNGQPGGLGTSEANVYNGTGTGTNGVLGTGSNGIRANSGGGGGGGGYYGGNTRGTQVVQYTVGCGAYGGSNYLRSDLQYITSQSGVCSGNGYIIIKHVNSTIKCRVQVINEGKVDGFVDGEKNVEVFCGQTVNLSVIEDIEKSIFQHWKSDNEVFSRKKKNIAIRTEMSWENETHIFYCIGLDIPDRRNEDFYKDNHDQYVYDADRLKRVIGV